MHEKITPYSHLSNKTACQTPPRPNSTYAEVDSAHMVPEPAHAGPDIAKEGRDSTYANREDRSQI